MALRTFARTFLGRVCLAGALAAAALTLAGCDGKNMDSTMDCPLPVVHDFQHDADDLSGYFVDSLPQVSKKCCKALLDQSKKPDVWGDPPGYVQAGSLAQPLISCLDSRDSLTQIFNVFHQCEYKYRNFKTHQECNRWQDSKPPPADWPEHHPDDLVKTMYKLGIGSSYASCLANLVQKILECLVEISDDAKVGFTMVQIVTTVGSFTLWFLCWLLGPWDICIDTVDTGNTNPVINFALNPTWFPLLTFFIGTGAWLVPKIKGLDEGTNTRTRTPPTRASVLSASFSGFYADAVMGCFTSMNWGGTADHFGCVVAQDGADFGTTTLMYLSSFCLVWTIYGAMADNMNRKPYCGFDSNLDCMTAAAGIIACACRTGQAMLSQVSQTGPLTAILIVTWVRSSLQVTENLTNLMKVCAGTESTSATEELLYAAGAAAGGPSG